MENTNEISEKEKVIIIQKVFAFYRKPVYDSLNKQVHLKVLYGRNNSGTKIIETDYSEVVPSFQYRNRESAVLLFPLWKIWKFRPSVVLCDLALGMLNLPVIILACKLMGIKFAFWSHGYNRKTGFQPERRWADRYRLWLLKWVDANIVYGQADKRILQEYLSADQLFVAQNTMDTPTLAHIKEELDGEGRQAVKRRLGIKQQYNIVYIGRMLKAKKPDLLVDVYSILKTKYGTRIGVHFIGDGKMLPQIKARVEAHFPEEDFYFHGAVHDNEKSGTLLYACDLMVLPGDLGLSANHAFCFGCPVVSFKQVNGFPAHGPEIEYVVHNHTGFLVEEHNAKALAAVINQYLTDTGLQTEVKRNIERAVSDIFPLEKMVGGAIECIEYLVPNKLLSMPL